MSVRVLTTDRRKGFARANPGLPPCARALRARAPVGVGSLREPTRLLRRPLRGRLRLGVGVSQRLPSAPEHFEAEVRAHLGAELAARAAVVEQRVAIALAIHRLGHDQHARRADGDTEEATLAELDVD